MPPATPSPLADFSGALCGLVAAASPRLVAVQSHRARSTGFFWRPGLVVTADEALAEEGDITITLPGGAAVPASLAGRDPSTDIALLRAAPTDPALQTLASAGVAQTGALALVVGAQDGGATAALGVVSHAGGAWQSMRGGQIDARIELSVALRRSAEGGLALDAAGGLLGMAVFGPRRRVLVIPAATIDRIAARLDAHGRVARGYLGLALQPVALDGGGAGAMVMGVDAHGPAAAAGICQGDVIAEWDGQKLGGLRAMLRDLGPERIGQTVTLSLRRAGAALEVGLTIGERPPT